MRRVLDKKDRKDYNWIVMTLKMVEEIQKYLDCGVSVSVRALDGSEERYDLLVSERTRGKLWLLRAEGSGVRSEYFEGVSLEDAMSLFDSLEGSNDLSLIRGVNPPLFCAEISPEEIDHESLEKSFESFARRREALREIGSRFFTGFDRA